MEKREGEESRARKKISPLRRRRETLLCLFLRAKPLRGKNEIFAPLGAEKETISVLSFLPLLLLRNIFFPLPYSSGKPHVALQKLLSRQTPFSLLIRGSHYQSPSLDFWRMKGEAPLQIIETSALLRGRPVWPTYIAKRCWKWMNYENWSLPLPLSLSSFSPWSNCLDILFNGHPATLSGRPWPKSPPTHFLPFLFF